MEIAGLVDFSAVEAPAEQAQAGLVNRCPAAVTHLRNDAGVEAAEQKARVKLHDQGVVFSALLPDVGVVVTPEEEAEAGLENLRNVVRTPLLDFGLVPAAHLLDVGAVELAHLPDGSCLAVAVLVHQGEVALAALDNT